MSPADATVLTQDTKASGALSPMLMGLTCITLLAIAIFHVVFVIPTFAALLAGLGLLFSAPTRLALNVANFGTLLVILGVGGLGALYLRGRKGPRERGHVETALSLTSLLLAVYVGLVSWAYVDAASELRPSNVRAAQHASTAASGLVRPD